MTVKTTPNPPEELDVAERLAAAVGNTPESVVYLARLDRRSGKYAHLRKYDIDTFDLEEVREVFGGGEYQARPRKEGKFVPGTEIFIVAGDELNPADTTRLARGHYAPAPDDPDGVGGAEASTAALLRELLFEIRHLRETPVVTANPVEMAAQLGAAASAQFASMVEMLGMRTDATKGASGSDPNSFERMMEIFKTGMEIGRESEGGGDYASIIGPLAQTLGRIMENQPQKGLEVKPDTTSKPGVTDPDFGRRPPRPIPAALEILLPMAREGASPEVWADVVVDRVPGIVEEVERAHTMFGSTEGVVESLVQFQPRVTNHQGWFGIVIKRILEYPADDMSVAAPDVAEDEARETEEAALSDTDD